METWAWLYAQALKTNVGDQGKRQEATHSCFDFFLFSSDSDSNLDSDSDDDAKHEDVDSDTEVESTPLRHIKPLSSSLDTSCSRTTSPVPLNLQVQKTPVVAVPTIVSTLSEPTNHNSPLFSDGVATPPGIVLTDQCFSFKCINLKVLSFFNWMSACFVAEIILISCRV